MSRRAVVPALTLALLSVPTAALAQIDTLAGTTPGSLTVAFASPDNCSECHATAQTSDGRAYLPFPTWQTSMMANATRDPLFLATLSDAEQDSPGIGTFCLRCHTPSGFTGGRAMPGDGSALDPLKDNDGVHCDVCHRAIDTVAGDPNAPYLSDAQLYYDDDPTGASPTRYGPYSDPFHSTRHPSADSAYVTSSRLCGGCHDLDNPLVHRKNADGTDTGENFPLQSTYSEWAQSSFAAPSGGTSCQGCHMPAETQALVASTVPNSPTRVGVRRHDFFGGNEWGMALLAAARPGVLDDEFADARTRAQGFLRTAARLEIVDIPRRVSPGERVSVTVRVTNLTGHKLPTGYEDARAMWLQVQAGDAVVTGDFQNDELVEDPQLRAYRFVPGRLVNGTVVPDDFVARHEVVLEDTRIPPAGMVPTPRTQPVGRDYSGGAAGALRNDDTATFAFTLQGTGDVPVRVRLLYRATTKHYVETIAAADHTDTRGQDLLADWETSGRAPPFEMASQTVMVTVASVASDAGSAGDGASAVDGAAMDGGTATMAQGCGCRAQRPAGRLGVLGYLAVVLVVARRRPHPLAR